MAEITERKVLDWERYKTILINSLHKQGLDYYYYKGRGLGDPPFVPARFDAMSYITLGKAKVNYVKHLFRFIFDMPLCPENKIANFYLYSYEQGDKLDAELNIYISDSSLKKKILNFGEEFEKEVKEKLGLEVKVKAEVLHPKPRNPILTRD